MKRMKKLMTMALAFVMALSLSVGALATGLTEVNDTSATDPMTLQNSVTSTGTNEGSANDVIKALIPTMSNGMFDMYLDPHGLIAQAQANENGRRFDDAESESAVSSDTYVYFQTLASTDEGGPSYTNKSRKLTVANKSNVPLVVDVELKATKGTGNEKIAFVDSLDGLKKDGEYLKTPAMYVGLTATPDGEDASDSAALNDPTFGDLTIADATDANGILLLKKAAFEWASTATDAMKAYVSNYLDDTTMTVTAAITSNEKTGVSVDAPAAAATFVSGAPAAVGSYTFTLSNDTAIQKTVDGASIAIKLQNTDNSKTVDVALFTFYLNQAKIDSEAATATGNLSATAVVGKWTKASVAEVSDQIANDPASYVLKYTPADTTNNTPAKYEYVAGESAPEDDALPKTHFQLEAGINPVSAWDGLAATAGSAIGLSVTWKIRGLIKDEAPVIQVTEPGAKSGAPIKFEVVSFGKSMHGNATNKGAAVGLYAISYPDANGKTVMMVVGADSKLTVDGSVYTLTESKVWSLDTINAVFLYPDGEMVSVPISASEYKAAA